MKKISEGRVIRIEFKSKALKGNPLKDPYIRKFPVYLPPGYGSGRNYPVVFLLAGFTGTGESNLNYSFLNENIEERINRLIRTKKMKDMIVVMPDCMTKYGGSQYINSTGTGKYEDHILELVNVIDENFSTMQSPGSRVVCGKSSGGYGALSLAMRNPDVFGLTYSIAGDTYFEYCYQPDFPKFVSFISKYGSGHAAVKKFIDNEVNYNQPKPSTFHSIINIIGMSACYSPNPAATKSKGYNFDLPFDINSGELDSKAFSKWLEKDPVRMINSYKKNLKKLKLICVDAGTRDEFNLNIGARIFSSKLKKNKIPHMHTEFDGGHFNIQYRYDNMFSIISDYVD